jgi:serine phosphatase RsbU (regulator of sigma subunit)/predicted enzyme related to lactoylglutathione lyase
VGRPASVTPLIISAMENAPSSSGAVRLDRQNPYLRLLCINIFVRDQERSLRFYVDQLGFGLVIDENYESGGRWLAVAPPDGNTVLALITPKRKSEDYKLIGRSKHAVLVTEDVLAKFDEWSKRGVQFHHPPQTTLWGGIFTRFDDLDGNSFTLVGRDDFVRGIEAERRAAAEKLEAERQAAQEIDIAKRVQARLFPQTLPPLKTLDYAGVCVQAHQVGGDYYDFLNLGESRLGLVIGDTSGKGIGAALLMANLQANLRSQSAIALQHPQRFLQSVNQLFYANTAEGSYATLFFGEYDDHSRCLHYANCGHYAPLLLRADNALEKLDSTGTVLGLFREWDCAVRECVLQAGDILVLYTDGITEAFNSQEEEFGEPRLIDLLRRNRHESAQAMLRAILDEVEKFSAHKQSDDITLIVAKCRGD